jgi:hypothetical protein
MSKLVHFNESSGDDAEWQKLERAESLFLVQRFDEALSLYAQQLHHKFGVLPRVLCASESESKSKSELESQECNEPEKLHRCIGKPCRCADLVVPIIQILDEVGRRSDALTFLRSFYGRRPESAPPLTVTLLGAQVAVDLNELNYSKFLMLSFFVPSAAKGKGKLKKRRATDTSSGDCDSLGIDWRRLRNVRDDAAFAVNASAAASARSFDVDAQFGALCDLLLFRVLAPLGQFEDARAFVRHNPSLGEREREALRARIDVAEHPPPPQSLLPSAGTTSDSSQQSIAASNSRSAVLHEPVDAQRRRQRAANVDDTAGSTRQHPLWQLAAALHARYTGAAKLIAATPRRWLYIAAACLLLAVASVAAKSKLASLFSRFASAPALASVIDALRMAFFPQSQSSSSPSIL